MQHVGNHRPGIFEPEELQEMQSELDQSVPLGESQVEREDRAFEILRRREIAPPEK